MRLFRCQALLFAAVCLLMDSPAWATAGEWNDRGIRYYEDGDYRGSIHCFRRALEAGEDNPTIVFNLASAHAKSAILLAEAGTGGGTIQEALSEARSALALRDDHAYFHKVMGYVYQEAGLYAEARSSFQTAAGLDNGDPSTLKLLGNVSYRLDDIDGALGFWDESYRLDPTQEKLEKRISRAGREQTIEKDFRSLDRAHFTISYDPSIEKGRSRAGNVIDLLDDARREIAGTIGFRTERTVPVVLYAPDRFREYTGGHDWTRGLYDGKIRLPIDSIDKNPNGLQVLATHEYVHAALYELARDRCPAWLNEGLAQVLAGEGGRAAGFVSRKRMETGRWIPLHDLERSFMHLPRDQVETAYAEAYLVTAYLLDSFTKRHLQRLLDEIRGGADPEAAVRSIYHRTYEELLAHSIEQAR